MRITILLLAFFLPFITYASTDITNGSPSGNVYWTADNSPYILHDDISILTGKDFTIGPGVTIMSASTTEYEYGPHSIYIDKNSVLSIQGNIENPVKIINVPIYSNGGTTTISYTHISGADTAIDARASNITINNSEISNNTIGILSNIWTPHPFLMYKDIGDSDYGIGGIGNALDMDTEQNIIEIHDSIIENNKEYSIINKTSNTIDARDNWWGNSLGPENILGPVQVDPWKVKNRESICCSNILFLPGLEASRLYKKENGVFWNSENTLWEPNRNDDVRKLFLDNDGYSIDPSIYTSDILDSAFGRKDIYKSFIAKMEAMVAEKTINTWLPFAYDWRMNVPDIVNGNTKYENNNKNLIEEVYNLASTSKTGKISIVAHSNGGLVAKMLGEELEKRGKIDVLDKVVLVAVPELGTPQAVAGILHGDNQSMLAGIILTSGVARTLGINMSSAYGLLPSKEYFNRFFGPIITYAGKALYSYDSFKSFLAGIFDGRSEPKESDLDTPAVLNSKIITKAEWLHDIIDNWQFPDNIGVFSIAGWGMPTTESIKYNKNFKNTEIIKNAEGDGTVLTRSAIGYRDDNIYINQALLKHNENKEILHNNILEYDSTKSIVSTILSTSSKSLLDNIQLPPYMSYNKPNANDYSWLSFITVSVHSPVDLNIYDSRGGHMGLIPLPDHPDSDILWMDNTIGGTYDFIGENKYFTIPADDNYIIQLKGTDYGTYTLKVDKFIGADMVNVDSVVYTDLPVTPSLIASTTASSFSLAPILNVDTNGDGKIDKRLKPEHREKEDKDKKKDKNKDNNRNKEKGKDNKDNIEREGENNKKK